MTFATTEELASALIRLEDDALRQFAEVYGPRLRGFLLNRGLTMADAESLAVSMITDIALKIPEHYIEQQGRFDAWVFTLVRNSLISWRRRQPPASEVVTEMSSEPIPADLDLVDAVQAGMKKLSPVDREIISRRDLGYVESFEEIGKDLNLDPRAARMRRSRALRKLGTILEADPIIRARLAQPRKLSGSGSGA